MKIGFIGVGNMGEGILRGALRGGVVPPAEIAAFDTNTDKVGALQAELGINSADSIAQLVTKSDLVLLAVKPHVCLGVLAEIKDLLKGKALISIAAGWSQARLAAALPKSARLLRVMPNTPALVGCGMSVFEAGNTLEKAEMDFATRLFSSIGRTAEVEPRLMDAVTAVSGSGPAYAYLFLESLADGGVREGLPRALAYELAAQTLLGGAQMLLKTGEHPGKLKDNVCSPGGTTIEAVAAMEANGLRAAVMAAVQACAEKSRELSK